MLKNEPGHYTMPRKTKKERMLDALDELIVLCGDDGHDCEWCVNQIACEEMNRRIVDLAYNQPRKFSYEAGKSMLLQVLINHPDYTGGVVTVK